MISIILLIFKIIGFVLLAMLLLVLLILFSILFVPLRYDARLIKTEEAFSGEVHLTWMLHLISVRARFDVLKKKSDMQFRVLGISPADITSFINKRKHERKRIRKRKGQPKKNTHTVNNSKKPSQNSDSSRNVTSRTPKAPSSARNALESESKKTDERMITHSGTDPGASKQGVFYSPPDPNVSKQETSRPSLLAPDVKSHGTSRRSRIWQKLLAYVNKIKLIPAKAKQMIRTIRSFLKKPASFLKKIEDFCRIAKKNDLSALCNELWSMLKDLLRHFRIRHGSGFLQFGTGDPSFTGEITGMIYLLLPAACGDIQIQPQFTEKAFRMDIRIRGHIRMIHIVRALWSAFRNTKLRGLLRDLRS